MYLSNLVFYHGQSYVAISCKTSPNNLCITIGDGRMPLLDGTTATCTENIVSGKVLDGSVTARHTILRIPQHLLSDRRGDKCLTTWRQGRAASNERAA